METSTELLPAETVDAVSQLFKALADPTRVRILHVLAQGECPVGRLAEALEMSQSAVSHQLGHLRAMRLVKHRRAGTTVLYSCDDSHVISLLRQAVHHSQHE